MPATEEPQDLASSSVQYSEAELRVLEHSAQILGVPLHVLLFTPQSQSRIIEIESSPDQIANSTIQHEPNTREPVPVIAGSGSFNPQSEDDKSHSAYIAPGFGWVEASEPGNGQYFFSEGSNSADVQHQLWEESALLSNCEDENLLPAGGQYNHPNNTHVSGFPAEVELSEMISIHEPSILPSEFEGNLPLSTCDLGDWPSILEHNYLPPVLGPNDATMQLDTLIAKAGSGREQEYPRELEQPGYSSTGDLPEDALSEFPNNVSADRASGSELSYHTKDRLCTSIGPDSQFQSNSIQWQSASSVNAAPAADDPSPNQQHQGEQGVDLVVEEMPPARSHSHLRIMRTSIARKSHPRGPYERNVTTTSQSQQPRRRGPFKDDQLRLETGLTRKTKACVRCRMQRIRCYPDINDPSGTCLTCSSISGLRLSKLPCLRYKIADTQLLDKGLHPRFYWTRRWTSMRIIEIRDWRSPEIKTITLTQDVGGVSYDLQVREYLPQEGDALQRTWKTGGIQHSYECAPYAIANMQKTGQDIIRLVDNNISTFIEFYVDEDNKLLRNTYSMAYRYMEIAERKEERALLRCVLRLWVASRMESRQERICSQETLGQELQLWDKEAGNYGCICVPPVLQAQIELITTAVVLLPMKKAVLKGLQELVHANDPTSWFTIYLTMFILLHSCALLTRAENVRAKREAPLGSEQRYHNPVLVEEFHLGANIMLAHFHYCNKGSHPFTDDWARSGNASLAKLDSEQLRFLQETVDQIKKRGAHFKHIKDNGMFEDEFYFIAQLYELDWRPGQTI